MNDLWFWITLVAGCSVYTYGWIKYGARVDSKKIDRSLMVRERELDGQVVAITADMDRELYRLLYRSES